MFIHIWLLPLALMATATLIAIPLSRYMAWIMDGKFRQLPVLGAVERRLDSGQQDWKQYLLSLLVFNTVLYTFSFVALALQPLMPLNPDGKGMLASSTIFNSVASFITNTNLQHYAGDVHLSNYSQIFFCIPNLFLSASVGLCALVAIIRLFRGHTKVGNFFVDMWRVLVYFFVPAAVAFGLVFLAQGHRFVEFLRHAGHDDVPVRAGADVRPDVGQEAARHHHFLGHGGAHGRHRRLVGLL